MAQLYAPLEIAYQMMDAWNQEGREGVSHIIDNLMNMKSKQTSDFLNLDDFLSWVIGSTFCKKMYQGPYTDMNERLLYLYKSKNMPYKESRKYFRDRISFATVFRCWMQYKQAYRFDDDFIGELMGTDTIAVPVEVLKRLPFRCFYLDLEETSRFAPYIGIFAYVGFDEITRLPNLGIFRIRKSVKEGQTYDIYSSTISWEEMNHWNMLFTNTDGEACIRFTNNSKQLQQLPDQDDTIIFDIVLFTLQAMLYLSSNEPDITPSLKRKYINLGKPKKQESELVLTDVGVRYGTTIRNIKRQITDDEESITIVTGKHRKITSHMRAAHWHHYWVGKGRTKRIVKWIPPTFVSGTGKELPVTIHKVSN